MPPDLALHFELEHVLQVKGDFNMKGPTGNECFIECMVQFPMTSNFEGVLANSDKSKEDFGWNRYEVADFS